MEHIAILTPGPGDTTTFTKNVWIRSGKPPRIILSEGWTEIEMFAFKDASELQTIRIPASVSTIDVQAFVNATNLQQVEFAEGSQLQIIDANAFSLTTALERINIPASVEGIAGGAFQGSGLREVTFENGLRLDRIGYQVFAMTKFLQRINIPASVKVINNEAFKGSGLQEVTFANGSQLERIGNEAFALTRSLQRINIPASVKVIGQSAFFETLNLTEVSFEQNSKITNIDPYAFSDSGLTLVTIGETALNRLNNKPSPLRFGPNNNFYGKENVTIVSRSQQINSLMFSMRKTPIPDELTRHAGTYLMKGVVPISPAALAARAAAANAKAGATAPNAKAGGRKSRTKKRGIRRKSRKTTRRQRRHKNKSRRRRSRIV